MTTLTAAAFNDLTAILTGKPAGRAASKADAEARFRREAAKAAIDADFILAHGSAYDCAKALEGDLKALSESRAAAASADEKALADAIAARDARIEEAKATRVSPGLARLRAHARFALYSAGQSVADFIAAVVAAGFPEREARADLSWDRRKGFIIRAKAAAAA